MGPWSISADALALAFLACVAWQSRKASTPATPNILTIAIVLSAVWALSWGLVPTLAAARWNAPPSGQPGAVMASVAVLSGAMILQVLRSAVRSGADMAIDFAGWRIAFGMMILASGLAGALPVLFYVPVALGDIIIGLTGIALRRRTSSKPALALLLWNGMGLVELACVLALGVTVLRPAMLSGAGFDAPGILPIAAVPLFMAMHIGGVFAELRSQR
ncbi:hypothetical protein [Erythrobacter sp.]|uniref:hypothetical protein n=1 Tax=Erythrobacter sp. TaxID=1042 RepID=UPI00311FC02D